LKINGVENLETLRPEDVSLTPTFEITFSAPIDPDYATAEYVDVSGSESFSYTLSSDNKTLTVTATQSLKHFSKYLFWISHEIQGQKGEILPDQFGRHFYTVLDPTPKLPLLPNDEDNDTDNTNDLLSVVQKQTFKYFYDFAHPVSGMARERNTSGDVVTSGGSGFGIMALIVGMERGFITRADGLTRMDKILDFLETADRFHGVWPHWINGNTGDVVPFSTNDNGGDLIETSFLVQGLLTFRQYLNAGVPQESSLIDRINVLWEGVEWDWYRRCEPTCQNVLYWHWSPNKNWIMNFAMYGYFEEQITYFLAAASPTHAIPKIVYSNGYGKNGAIVKNNTYEGITLPLESPSPLFWVQYSYLGLDPHFTDDYANYWTQNVNASLINYKYCVRNPKNYIGYSDECWGLTSSDNQNGYNAHSPQNDLGVITPTAALSSFPYTPVESMKALKLFYYKLGDKLWGQYGFYDAFNPTENWYANSYLAIDQGPIIVMIENYRTGLLWDLFMSAPEVQTAMNELDFN
ncbi:MAG TPA: glucoamylase family protein, partial [Cyclobacteriaceae bacterium]